MDILPRINGSMNLGCDPRVGNLGSPPFFEPRFTP